jgi:23S rRNA (adenine1618-N6)-methyltransferase
VVDEAEAVMIRRALKDALHVRNRFRSGYDFAQLAAVSPALTPFLDLNAYGDTSIDYADPRAVKALNQALLAQTYGLTNWDIPAGALCPPVPGRSDYIHYLADLLAENDAGAIPRGREVVILDVGTGANCVYPLVGSAEYGWRFVATDIDPSAVQWARTLVAAHAVVADLIECRLQPTPARCFRDIVHVGEQFAASMCNPPFHASAAEAAAGTRRKQRNLGTSASAGRNFGGRPGELWCDGGELGFVGRMIAQSAAVRDRCGWFTTLVSNSAHLPRLHDALRRVNARDVRTISMAQGQKQSRILAWRF